MFFTGEIIGKNFRLILKYHVKFQDIVTTTLSLNLLMFNMRYRVVYICLNLFFFVQFKGTMLVNK